MWVVKITNKKGVRYKYTDRYIDYAADKIRKMSITLSRRDDKGAMEMLNNKLNSKYNLEKLKDEIKTDILKQILSEKQNEKYKQPQKLYTPHKHFIEITQKMFQQNNLSEYTFRTSVNGGLKQILNINSIPLLTERQLPIAIQFTKDYIELIKNIGMIYVIKIKSRFKGWLPATKEQALRYARHIYSGAVALRGEYKTEYINTNYLKGVTLTEGELRGR